MAYGLKKITGTYQANGTGRDWFFMGDFEYRQGRRTPQANAPGLRPKQKPPMQPLGAPAEVAAGNLRTLGAKTSQVERWAKRHAERGEGFGGPKAHTQALNLSASEPALASTTGSAKSLREAGKHRKKGPRGDGSLAKTTFESSQWQYGSIPNWAPKKYELARAEENVGAGIPRGPCAYDEIAGSGDMTRGIKGSMPHFSATLHDLGQVEVPGQTKRVELEFAATNRDAKVPEADKNFKRQEGDHSMGIVGKLPHHKSTMSDLGYEQPNWKQPEYGAPMRHTFSASPTFFDKPDLKAKKAQEGDECLGIKAKQPHFRSTYSDLGNIPGWHKKKYDFGPVANMNYRFTVWRE